MDEPQRGEEYERIEAHLESNGGDLSSFALEVDVIVAKLAHLAKRMPEVYEGIMRAMDDPEESLQEVERFDRGRFIYPFLDELWQDYGDAFQASGTNMRALFENEVRNSEEQLVQMRLP